MTRGAWRILRAYRDAQEEVERVIAANPRDWLGCWNSKNQAIGAACADRYRSYEIALAWAAALRFRVDMYAAHEDKE